LPMLKVNLLLLSDSLAMSGISSRARCYHLVQTTSD